MRRSSILSQLGWLCTLPSDEAPWLVSGPLGKLGETASWLCPVGPVHRTCCTEPERFFPYRPSISHGFFSSPAQPVILVYSIVREVYNLTRNHPHILCFSSLNPCFTKSQKATGIYEKGLKPYPFKIRKREDARWGGLLRV